MPSHFEEQESDEPNGHSSDDDIANADTKRPTAAVSADALERQGSAFRSDQTPRSKIRISTQDGAAEICIIDHTYALVASGVGKLDVSLAAGDYQLRQRVGDEEQIQPLTVQPGGGEQAVELPPLEFPSPIPLPGTSLAGPLGAEAMRVEKASGNFRLLLWTPEVDLSAGSRKHAHDVVEAQLKRLRLESFRTGAPQNFAVVVPDESDLANSISVLVASNLSPGPYVLIQEGPAGRQRCMPVWICPGFVTALFLLVFQGGDDDVQVQLDHTAVAILAAEDFERNYASTLLQLESARKALGMARPVHGWTSQSLELSETNPIKNPLLSLMDAQLMAGKTTQSEIDNVQSYTNLVADLLGNDFPDVVALRTLAQVSHANMFPEKKELLGPPLLRRSWTQLLATPKGNAALGKLMDFTFQLDGTGTWLIWSEDKDGRQKRARYTERLQSAPTANVPITPPIGSNDGFLWGLVVKGIYYLTGRLSRGYERSKDEVKLIQLTQVSVDKVVQMLVVLSESGILQRLWDKGQQLAAEQGIWVNQDSMRHLVASLQVLLDKTLVKAMGAETLVRQSLDSLGLPDDKIVDLARSLMSRLLENVSKQDRALALKTLEGVLTVAGTWLKDQGSVPALSVKADD